MSFKNGFVSGFARVFPVLLIVAGAAVMGGCKNNVPTFIDHVTFKPSDSLDTVRVSMVFGTSVQSDLSAGFMVKDYGYLFINPYAPSSPFEIGFELKTSVLNDQEYIGIEPTQSLPNGMPIGIDYGLVEVRSKQPVSADFDLYGYVDVLHASWMGTAAIFNFINDRYFPNGLQVSQTFLRDSQGLPGVIASVFGPTVSSDGSVKTAGGIALFANVRQLIETQGLRAHNRPITLYPEAMPTVQGQNASEYQAHPAKLLKLQSRLIREMNNH